MIRNLSVFLLALSVFSLSACGTAQEHVSGGPLLPLPTGLAVNDPGNDVLMGALEDYIHAAGGPSNSQFEFTRIDLNGDGRREGVVLLKSPHSYWCNENGCRMLVLEAGEERFEMCSEISSVRGPLIVTQARSHGWRDIVARVSGRTGWDAKDVALRFDGTRYPPYPAFEPPMKVASAVIDGVRIFP